MYLQGKNCFRNLPAAQPSQAEQLIDVILMFFMGDKSE
jgi:hypothetical protein